MGGVTVAHQGTTTLSTNETITIDQEHLSQLLAHQADYVPVEDLTGEVEELMMRESVSSWLQPWSEENNACLVNLDAYAESMQLEELFGQQNQTVVYDAFEHTDLQSSPVSSDTSAQTSPILEKSAEASPFMSDTAMVESLAVVAAEPPAMEEPLKRKRGLVSSDESSEDESSSEEEEEESDSETEQVAVIPTTVANMNSRVVYSSDESDSESEMAPSRASSPSYMYMHKRQIEETLLDRITNQLQPERLPGILPILASDKANSQQEDEIEIDLSCLARDQLVQVLLYVDACILEQEGGPAVNVEDYIKKKKGPRSVRRRPPMPKKTKTRAELTEDIDADSSSSSDDDDKPSPVKKTKAKPVSAAAADGPISMASLSKKRKGGRKGVRKSRKVADDDVLVSSVSVVQDPNSIASSRPKRRSALHKRRLLEEMLAPSDEEEDEEEDEDTQLVVFGDEKMDFGVLRNETIVHQEDVPVIAATAPAIDADLAENTDEEIDIMF